MKCNIQKAGFTFVEVVVSVGIFTLVMVAISLLFMSLYKQQSSDIAFLQRMHAANAAIDKMGEELRKANRGENGNFTIASAGASSMIFYSDIDNDNLTEKVTYILQGANLQRIVVEPGTGSAYAGAGTTTTLCGNVRNGTNPIFRYYDENYAGSGSPLAAPVEILKIRVVGISLDINSLGGMSSYPFHAETKIQLRNLK